MAHSGIVGVWAPSPAMRSGSTIDYWLEFKEDGTHSTHMAAHFGDGKRDCDPGRYSITGNQINCTRGSNKFHFFLQGDTLVNDEGKVIWIRT